MTCCIEPAALKKKKKAFHGRVYFGRGYERLFGRSADWVPV